MEKFWKLCFIYKCHILCGNLLLYHSHDCGFIWYFFLFSIFCRNKILHHEGTFLYTCRSPSELLKLYTYINKLAFFPMRICYEIKKKEHKIMETQYRQFEKTQGSPQPHQNSRTRVTHHARNPCKRFLSDRNNIRCRDIKKGIAHLQMMSAQ